LLLVVWL